MQLQTIEDDDYEAWIQDCPQRNFLQSSMEGHKMEQNGWTVTYWALTDRDEIQICAMICIKPLFKVFHYAYLPRGPLYKKYDEEKIQTFYLLLKRELKHRHCIYLETDPYIMLQERDKNGDIVPEGQSHFEVVELYKKCGFEHLPLTRGYDMVHQCRWMSVLDLQNTNKENLFKSFPSKTRQNIKNTMKNNIKVRMLQKDELHILTDMVEKTSERRHFGTLPLTYYEQQYDCFKGNAEAYYAYLDIEEYHHRIYQDIQKEEQTIKTAKEGLKNNPHSKNSQNRLNVALSHLDALHKRLQDAEELKKQHGKELGLAAAMFIFYGQEVIYLMSGSDDAYKRFKGPYALQWQMIQKALERGYTKYNFYGISGLFEPGQDGYGVFDFKRGFNATVVELIGDFILPVQPLLYEVYKKKNHI